VSGDLQDDSLICAFVGLPQDVSTNLKSACKLEVMNLNDVVERARILMSMRRGNVCAAGTGRNVGKQSKLIRCFGCGVEGHTKRFCPELKKDESSNRLRGYQCGSYGHIAKFCPTKKSKKAEGNPHSAPVGSHLEGRSCQ
jgi:ribosome modulation factor